MGANLAQLVPRESLKNLVKLSSDILVVLVSLSPLTHARRTGSEFPHDVLRIWSVTVIDVAKLPAA